MFKTKQNETKSDKTTQKNARVFIFPLLSVSRKGIRLSQGFIWRLAAPVDPLSRQCWRPAAQMPLQWAQSLSPGVFICCHFELMYVMGTVTGVKDPALCLEVLGAYLSDLI